MNAARGAAPASPIDRAVHGLFACVLFLTVLFLWQRYHERSCLALGFPALTFLAIFYGLLEHRLERRRFAVDYYLDPASSLRRRLRRTCLPVPISLAAAVPPAAFLIVFAARSRPTDWIFLCGAAVAAPLLCTALALWPGPHFRRSTGEGGSRAPVADLLVTRTAGTLLLGAVTAVYLYASYHLIAVPGEDIFPGSLERTVDAFTARARSACPIVEDTLSLAAQLEGLSWYFVTTAATAPWLHHNVQVLVWIGFFLNAAMAFAGFVRGLEGSMLLAGRAPVRRRRE